MVKNQRGNLKKKFNITGSLKLVQHFSSVAVT